MKRNKARKAMIKGVVVERRDMLTDCNENGGGGGGRDLVKNENNTGMVKIDRR